MCTYLSAYETIEILRGLKKLICCADKKEGEGFPANANVKLQAGHCIE